MFQPDSFAKWIQLKLGFDRFLTESSWGTELVTYDQNIRAVLLLPNESKRFLIFKFNY